MDIIRDNPEKPWDWIGISRNPNLTWETIRENPDKTWSWYGISNNKFDKEKNNFMVKEYYKHLMAYRIQYRWKNALVNPNCRVGINKIGRDMDYAGL